MRLLKEFFSQLASPASYEKQIGFFIPTGAVHTLGTQNYVKLISENHAFIQSMVAIPIGDFQHATLDIPFLMDANTDIDKTTLVEVIGDQPWCLNIGRTNVPNKIIIATTKDMLDNARKWIDYTLPELYAANIEDQLDVTTLQKMTPRRLDRPVLTAASTAYVANLCTRASYAKVTTTGQVQTSKQTRMRKLQPDDVSFAESEFPPLKKDTNKKNPSNPNTSQPTPKAAAPATTASELPPYDYKAEMDRRAKEIENTLRPQFERLFSQLEQKIDALVQAREDQEKVNVNYSRQLDFLVEAVTKLIQNPINQLHNNTQSLCSGDGRL